MEGTFSDASSLSLYFYSETETTIEVIFPAQNASWNDNCDP